MQEIMQNGSEYEKMKAFVYMQRGAMKAQQESNQKLTGICFDQCINSMSTSHVTGDEKKCLSQCVTRHLHAQERLQQQFQAESMKNKVQPPTEEQHPIKPVHITL
eukprot:UN07173